MKPLGQPIRHYLTVLMMFFSLPVFHGTPEVKAAESFQLNDRPLTELVRHGINVRLPAGWSKSETDRFTVLSTDTGALQTVWVESDLQKEGDTLQKLVDDKLRELKRDHTGFQHLETKEVKIGDVSAFRISFTHSFPLAQNFVMRADEFLLIAGNRRFSIKTACVNSEEQRVLPTLRAIVNSITFVPVRK